MWMSVAVLVLILGGAVWIAVLVAKAEQGKAAKRGLENAKKARKIEDDVSRLSDAELRERLRKYTRSVRDDQRDYPNNKRP